MIIWISVHSNLFIFSLNVDYIFIKSKYSSLDLSFSWVKIILRASNAFHWFPVEITLSLCSCSSQRIWIIFNIKNLKFLALKISHIKQYYTKSVWQDVLIPWQGIKDMVCVCNHQYFMFFKNQLDFCFIFIFKLN